MTRSACSCADPSASFALSAVELPIDWAFVVASEVPWNAPPDCPPGGVSAYPDRRFMSVSGRSRGLPASGRRSSPSNSVMALFLSFVMESRSDHDCRPGRYDRRKRGANEAPLYQRSSSEDFGAIFEALEL